MRTQTREEQVIQLIAASGMLLCLFMLSLRVPRKKEMTLKAFASSSRSLHLTSSHTNPNSNPYSNKKPHFHTHWRIQHDSFAVRVSAGVYVTLLFMLPIFTYSSDELRGDIERYLRLRPSEYTPYMYTYVNQTTPVGDVK